MNSDDLKGLSSPERMKAIIDLRHFIDTILRDGQPKVGVMFKKLSITPKTMSDLVLNACIASSAAIPYVAVDITNDLFKMGITIGYRYAMTVQMEQQFHELADNDGQGHNGQSVDIEDDTNDE